MSYIVPLRGSNFKLQIHNEEVRHLCINYLNQITFLLVRLLSLSPAYGGNGTSRTLDCEGKWVLVRTPQLGAQHGCDRGVRTLGASRHVVPGRQQELDKHMLVNKVEK